MAGNERATRWTVHVEWLDGQRDEVIGDPNVVDDVLVVSLDADDDTNALAFEAQYPLRHVRVWWCDYAGDTTRANARGRRTRVRGLSGDESAAPS